LPNPYDCKDGDFDTVDELLLVRGVTKDLFFGGLRQMITVYKGKRASDSRRININAASPQMLLSLPQMTEDLVQEIIEYRKTQDFRSLNDLIAIVGGDVYNAIAPYVGLQKSDFYTIKSVGRVKGSQARHYVKALVEINPGEGKGYRIIQWLEG
jgi:general secretion pathway protein K